MKSFWLALPLIVLTVGAELPQARLWSVFPPGAKTGSTVEVTITGGDLDDATTLLFSTPGITTAPKLAAGSTNIEPNKFVVTIPDGTTPGRCDLRVSGRFGASNPRSFFISTLNEVTETEPNNSREEAMKLVLPVVVNGVSDAENYDFFRFSGKKAERLIFRCLAEELDSRILPSLLVADSNGLELAHSRKNGFLEFNPPADGDYLVQINDLLFKGGGEYAYRLEAGAIPNLDYIEPTAGKPGTKSEYRLIGRNLPNGKPAGLKSTDGKDLEETKMEIEFPKSGTLPTLGLKAGSITAVGFPYSLQATNGSSNPFPLAFAEGEIVAQKPESVSVTVPSTYCGRFHPVHDTEWLEFIAEKGEVFSIEVISERFGFPTDPHILIQRITKNDKGEAQYSDLKEAYDLEQNLGGREFNTASRDAALRFEAPEKGGYRVQTRDMFNLTKGKLSLPYTLQIRKETPGIALAVAPYAPPNPNKEAKTAHVWVNFLRKGDKQPIKVFASRKDGYAGEIGIIAEGLPKGVTLAPLSIPPGATTATLIFQSSPEAEGFSGPVRITGRAHVSNQEINVEAVALCQTWNVEDYTREEILSRTANNVIAVSSLELAPVSIDTEDKTWETSLGGKVTVPLKITRRGEFNNTLKFRLLTDPPKEWDVDGKAAETSVEVDIKGAKLSAGRTSLIILAQTTGKYRRVNPEEQKAIEEEIKHLQGQKDSENRLKELNAKIAQADVSATFWCNPININVTPTPVQVQLASSSMELKPGGKTELSVRISRLYDYKDAVELSVTIPQDVKGVSAAKISIPADQAEGKLVFESATDAPAGEKKAVITALARQNGLELKSEHPISFIVSAPAAAK